MGDLPKERVNISLPFHNTGVDYTGPFTLKDRKGRGYKTYKAYICLFICLNTKAVHLELVSSLTSDAFIVMFKRFISRRGLPANMYSDNGTNIVGSNNEIKQLFEFLKNSQDELVQDCANLKFCWHFIPPNSPNFGGLWEANVK